MGFDGAADFLFCEWVSGDAGLFRLSPSLVTLLLVLELIVLSCNEESMPIRTRTTMLESITITIIIEINNNFSVYVNNKNFNQICSTESYLTL